MFRLAQEADLAVLGEDRAPAWTAACRRRPRLASIEADTTHVGAKPAFDHAQREQIAERHLARLKLQTGGCRRGGGVSAAFSSQGFSWLSESIDKRNAARRRADQAHGDLLEAPLQAIAAIVDGEAAVADADLGRGPCRRTRSRRPTCRRAPTRQGRRSRPARPRGWPRDCVARPPAAKSRDGTDWVRGWSEPTGAMVSSGRSPPAKTLARPSSSIWTTRLASTRRKLAGARIAHQQACAGNADLRLRSGRHQRAAGISHHDVAQPQRRAPIVVALELRAADLDAVAAAEILLDAAVSHGVATSSEIGPLASRHQTAPQAMVSTANRPQSPMVTRRTTGWRRSNMNKGLKGSRQLARRKLGRRKRGTRKRGMRKRRHTRAELAALNRARRSRHRRLPARADAAPARPPSPAARRCADCCSGPSCPIGRPLVRRSETEPLGSRFTQASQGFRTKPPRIANSPTAT